MIQEQALNIEIPQSSLVPLASLPSTEPWLIYALGGGWGHLVRSLSFGRIAAIHRPVIILCNSPYAAQLLQYEASDRRLYADLLLAKEPVKIQKQEVDEYSGLLSTLSMLPFSEDLRFTFENSEFLETTEPLPIVEGCYLQVISPIASSSTIKNQVRQMLAEEQYECVIVDTFPRGLGGELAEILPLLSAPKVLIHRDINPDYVVAKNLPDFVADNFDLVIVPGEGEEMPLAELPQVRHTAPWLIRSAGELPDVTRARTLLGLNPIDTNPLIVICAAGRAEELSLYGNLTRVLAESLPGVTVRCLAPECPENCPAELWVFHWPGIECLPAADVVVGGAGYNTFYECLSVGVPLVAFAFKRQYDRQEMRVLRWIENQATVPVKLVESVEGALSAVCDFLNQAKKSISSAEIPKAYMNGAAGAVKLIEQFVSYG
ncbi:hypothetical protein [Microcoleus sp. FACHB-672]|uniref:hypothetical protein n=1 Tax=Microcoleus sp. FACHB-672 TaxID=2692825 RepID=UPI0016876B60|nr:hypothetical protein [Microcoleus sp. FACHB-672]MBD2041741.1 hypothetical protein [Microcoleus sp. FACHB-672]